MLMQAAPNCPCCGPMADLRWDNTSRVLAGKGHAVQISPLRAKIFNRLWQNFYVGRPISVDELMGVVYADDPNGGPDSDNIISVQMLHLKNQLKPFGLSIKGRTGYALVVALAGNAGET